METLKAWGIVVGGLVAVIVTLAVIFFMVPKGLDSWDKARAQTRIEVKDMEAVADFMRANRVRAALIGK